MSSRRKQPRFTPGSAFFRTSPTRQAGNTLGTGKPELMEDVRLDVRTIPPPQRHPKIFALFDELLPGQGLVLRSDHEPRPLRAEFDHKRPGIYQWVQRQLGDGHWEVRLTHVQSETARSPLSATLSRTPLFQHLDARTIELLAYQARHVAAKRNQIVAEQSVNWPYVGVVERGAVQAILSTSMGRERTMYEVLPHEVFGEIAFLDGGLMPLRFVAVTSDTIVILLSREAIRSLAERFPSTVDALAMAAAQHFRAVVDRFAAHLSQSTTARVAHALLPYAPPDEGMCAALESLPSMTQNEIAMRAGTVKEVVSRAIAELEEAGALEREGGHIVRLDRQKLNNAADAGV